MNGQSYKKQRTSTGQNVSSPLLKIQCYKLMFEEKRKIRIHDLIVYVKKDINEIREIIGKRRETLNSIVENLVKIHFAAPELMLTQFEGLVRESEILNKAYLDLKIVWEEIDKHIQESNDSFSFKFGDQSPAVLLTRYVIRKHYLLMSINERNEAAEAKRDLQKMRETREVREIISESAFKEISPNFETKDQETELKNICRIIDNFDFKKTSEKHPF